MGVVVLPYARVDVPMTAHMADHLVPVNCDITQLDAGFVEEDDPPVNPLGVMGLGEIAVIAWAPAIANALFHVTGKRVRTCRSGSSTFCTHNATTDARRHSQQTNESHHVDYDQEFYGRPSRLGAGQ